MVHASRATKQKLAAAFGFDVVVMSFSNFRVGDEIRTRYSCKRPNGKKWYHAISFADGSIVGCGR